MRVRIVIFVLLSEFIFGCNNIKVLSDRNAENVESLSRNFNFGEILIIRKDSFNGVYRDHILDIENINLLSTIRLSEELVKEIKDFDGFKQSSYYTYNSKLYSQYFGLSFNNPELSYHNTHVKPFLKSINYLKNKADEIEEYSNTRLSQVKLLPFTTKLLYKLCVPYYQDSWIVEPKIFLSKQLEDYIFSDNDNKDSILYDLSTYRYLDLFHGLLPQITEDKENYFYYPYYLMSESHISFIYQRLSELSIPKDKLLQEEFMHFREIFHNANKGEWLILVYKI